MPSIARDLDWIAVMSYDYHGSWNKKTGHVSPMYDHPDNRYDSYNTVNISFFTCRVRRVGLASKAAEPHSLFSCKLFYLCQKKHVEN